MTRTTTLICILTILFMVGSIFTGVAMAMSPLDNTDAVLDPDGDGLTNVEEFNAGTDPGNPDTDNDGLPDGWEYDYQLDPTDPSDAANDEDYAGDEEYAAYTQVPGPHYTNYDEYYRYWYTEDNVDFYQHTNPQNGNTDGDEFLDPDDPWPLNYKNDGVGGGSGGANQGGDAGSGPAEGGEGGDGDGDGNPDDDGDGLSDTAEAEMGTDPNNPDTDGDGLTDDQEVKFGLDPNDWDTDNDLLRDGVELGLDQQSTDGHFVDTDNDAVKTFQNGYDLDFDGDGITDMDEAILGTNPAQIDTDGDGLSDSDEIDLGLDPLNWDTDGDLMSDGLELGCACGSTSPHLKDSDNDGLEDPWEDNDLDGMINIEEQDITGTDPNDNDTDSDGIPDDLELQLVEPGPINANSHKYHKYTQFYPKSDNNGADGKNASGPDGRPGIAWTDDNGNGEPQSPTNYYDVNGDGIFTLYKLNTRGEYIMTGLAPDDPNWARIPVDWPTTDVSDNDTTDGIPLVLGTAALADGKDNDFSGVPDDGIDEIAEIAYSADGAPGKPGVDDDGDSKDSDGDGYCDGQEVFYNSDPNDDYDIPMHQDANGDWVADPIMPFSNWIDEPDEYGWPGTDDLTDDSADDNHTWDTPNFRYDRYNPTLDISWVDGPIDVATEGAFRWWVPYLWRSHEFFLAGKGGLHLNSTCVAWVHWNPAMLLWMGIDVRGDYLWDRGAPYRWNHYDIDPRFADTDTDVPIALGGNSFDLMEDSWDPRPTIPDDRLDTYVDINYIKDTASGIKYDIEFGAGSQQLIFAGNGPAISPTAHDAYGFPHIITNIPMQKGIKYEMSLFIGIEQSPPDSLPIRRGWYRPYNITIGWHNMSFGEDQVHYTGDDDYDGDGVPFYADQTPAGWAYTPDNADMPLISLSRSDLQADKVPADLGLDTYDTSSAGAGWPSCQYFQHSGLEIIFGNVSVDGSVWPSKITFYEMKFFFYIPEGCPSGFIFIDVVGEADENIHIFNTPDAFTGYPMMYN